MTYARPWPSLEELQIQRVQAGEFPSPMLDREVRFTDDRRRTMLCLDPSELEEFRREGQPVPSVEKAGPRQTLAFDPEHTTCAIVTCGGLCPGLNDVIRSIVLTARHMYGVSKILGFRYGYEGLGSSSHPPLPLEERAVKEIHNDGGTILGSSRGPKEPSEMVDTLVREGVDILFTLGGDGTLRGASAIAAEIDRRGLSIAVVGIPKTIDNDLEWVQRSFGFATAVEEASRALAAAHAEACGAWNGIGLVKLMGRHAGFIAAHAVLARGDANFCLIPESRFDLNGPRGFLAALHQRLEQRRHALVVVAEGACQDLIAQDSAKQRDASGNVKLQDVGLFLKRQMSAYLKERDVPHTIKYIDPSYMIRGCPANAQDSEYCLVLGQQAVHAGMAGRTDLLVGFYAGEFVHLPICVATSQRKTVDPHGTLWRSVLQATGQPFSMLNTPASPAG